MQLIRNKLNLTIKLIIGLIFLTLVPSLAFAGGPDCTGPDQYPASVAFVYLKNAGIVNNYNEDFTKTKVVRLASEKIGKDLYRQVHYIAFTNKSGMKISVITVNDASFEECSMSQAQVLVIKEQLEK